MLGLREAPGGVSCLTVSPIRGVCARCSKRQILKTPEFRVGKVSLINKVLLAKVGS